MTIAADEIAPTAAAVRWGSADDAGALCRTADAEHGVTGRTYRSYVSRAGAPAHGRYNPQTGVQEYDLDAVAAWHAARTGRGRRTLADGAMARRTEFRHTVLAAADGGVLLAEGSTADHLDRDGLRLSGEPLTRGARQAAGELHAAGFLTVSAGRLRPTPRGRELLAEWSAATG